MSKYILTVTLNPAIDRMILLKDFKLGSTSNVTQQYVQAGGKGVNVSRFLTRLNVPTRATGFLAGMTGSHLKERLDQEGIANEFVMTEGMTRENVTIIDTRNKKQTRLMGTFKSKNFTLFQKKFTKLLSKSRCVVFAGSLPQGASVSMYNRLIKLAHKRGVLSVLDASQTPLIEGIKAKPYLVKPNATELKSLYRGPLRTHKHYLKAIDKIHAFGVKLAIISLSKKGCVASNQKEVWIVTPPSKRSYRDVGCGDVLLAAFLKEHLSGRSFSNSLTRAVAHASAYAGTPYDKKFKISDSHKILKHVKLKQIH